MEEIEAIPLLFGLTPKRCFGSWQCLYTVVYPYPIRITTLNHSLS